MKERIRQSIMVLLVGMLFLSACKKEDTAVSDTLQSGIYYVNTEKMGLYRLPYEEEIAEGNAGILKLLSLLEDSSEGQYLTPIGSSFSLNGYTLEAGQLTLDFSAEYHEQDAIMELLNRAAIVRTLAQVPDVDGVSFTVDGEVLTDMQGVPVGVMNAEQFILNAGREINAYEQAELTLYFANEDGTGLKEIHRTVVYSSNISLDRLVMDELIAGVHEDEDGYPTINPATRVLSTTVTDGICYVNLDSSFLVPYYSASPEAVIYSIVNSLVALPNIHKVMLSVDGDSSVIFLESISLNGVFERNLEVIG